MGELIISPAPKGHGGKDILRVNKAAGKIHAVFHLYRFKDKDTNQIIVYCPSIDFTGYGENSDKATEMLKFSILDYFEYLIELPTKQIEEELRKLGWKHDKLLNKQYSKAYVDINGELQNFNAVDNKVERLTLATA